MDRIKNALEFVEEARGYRGELSRPCLKARLQACLRDNRFTGKSMNMQSRHYFGLVAALAVVGLFGFSTAAGDDSNRPDDPISAWTFDGHCEDVFGGNHGTAPNGMVYVIDGPLGQKALDLSGNAGEASPRLYVDIGNPESLQMTTGMTVSTWIRTGKSSGGFRYPIAKYRAGQRQWAIATIYQDQHLVARFSVDGINGRDARPLEGAVGGQGWQHVVLTLDSESGVRMYLNGERVSQWHTGNRGAITNPVTEVHEGLARITVGASSDLDSATFFQGHIGETAIWNQVLTDDQIAWLSQNSIVR